MDQSDNNNLSGAQSPQTEAGVTTDKAFSGTAGTPDNTVTVNADTLPKKHRAPIGAIILAVIVAGALAAATIFAYRQTNKPATSEQATETSDSVSGSDVDATADEVDQTVSEMDSASDFVESELSDTTLGL